MRRSIGFATVAALTAAHPYVALGQSSKIPNPPEQSVQAEVMKALEAAGFKDVKIEPGTFAVHAKDPSGSPVMMVINPDTFGSDTEHEGQRPTELPDAKPGETHSSVDDEQATGALPNMNGDFKPSLTPAQKQVVWQNLSSVKTMHANRAKGFAPKIGATVPYGVSVQPLPGDIADTAPSLAGYHYVMMQKEIVIVHPKSKKVVEVIKEQ
jgi:Protein of unknown function (DUF1236)